MRDVTRVAFSRWLTIFLMNAMVLVIGLTAGGVLHSEEDGILGNSDSTAEGQRLRKTIAILNQTSSGRSLIQRALQVWKLRDLSGLLEYFQLGDVSRTDTILTRHLNLKTGQEDRERKITIYLRDHQPQLELALDMAHELVHAVARPSFDPYDANLTVGKYILEAIEGEGGEVNAVLVECEVGSELAAQSGAKVPRCQGYASKQKERIRRDFYKVGRWMPEVLRRLGKEAQLFSLLTADPPKLYSSTGHAPYPASLAKEFDEITQMACENSRNRIRSMEISPGLASLSSLHLISAQVVSGQVTSKVKSSKSDSNSNSISNNNSNDKGNSKKNAGSAQETVQDTIRQFILQRCAGS